MNPMNQKIQKKKMTIATRFFLLFFAVMILAEGSYLWFSRDYISSLRGQGSGKKDLIEETFSPAQTNRLKSFLESTKPDEIRKAVLEGGKIYNIDQGLSFQEINQKTKIILEVAGYEKDKNLRAVVTTPSGSPLKIKNSTQMVFRGIQFESPSSSAPVISIENCNGVQFENCSLKGNGGALKIVSSYNISFRKVGFLGSGSRTFHTTGSENFLISDCRFTGESQKGYGLYVEGSEDKKESFFGTIQNCVFENFRVALYVSSVKLNIYKCVLQKNDTGIRFDSGSSGKVGGAGQENKIIENQKDGVYITGGSRPDFYENKISQNEGNGITIENGSMVLIKHTIISANHFSGVEVATSSKVTLVENTIVENGKGNRKYGVHLRDKGEASIIGNKIVENAEGGIHLKDCGTNITIEKNQIEGNGGFGIFLENLEEGLKKKIKEGAKENQFKKNKYGPFGPPN